MSRLDGRIAEVLLCIGITQMDVYTARSVLKARAEGFMELRLR